MFCFLQSIPLKARYGYCNVANLRNERFADEGRSDFDVDFTIIICGANVLCLILCKDHIHNQGPGGSYESLDLI